MQAPETGIPGAYHTALTHHAPAAPTPTVRLIVVLYTSKKHHYSSRIQHAIALASQARAAGDAVYLLTKHHQGDGSGWDRATLLALLTSAPHPLTADTLLPCDERTKCYMLVAHSSDTVQDAAMCRLAIEKLDLLPADGVRLTVVTSAYHAARADLLFATCFAERHAQPGKRVAPGGRTPLSFIDACPAQPSEATQHGVKELGNLMRTIAGMTNGFYAFLASTPPPKDAQFREEYHRRVRGNAGE